MAKETEAKMKRHPTEWFCLICALNKSEKDLISNIYKELTKINNNKLRPYSKMKRNAYFSLKETDKWPRSTQKVAHYHFSGKRKSRS